MQSFIKNTKTKQKIDLKVGLISQFLKRHLRGKFLPSLFFILLGILAIYQFAYRIHHDSRLKKETKEDEVYSVSVVSPKSGSKNETTTFPGNIEAWYQAPIYAQVAGYVKMWYKDYGAVVKKGDVLAEINTPALNAQYEQAKADMRADKARADLAALTAKRYTAMRKSKAVSEQAISVKQADAKAEYARYLASQHHVDNYEAQLKFKTIVAPYDGVVIYRGINVGDYVNKEGMLSEGDGKNFLFKIADIGKMRLFVSVPERFGGFLSPGLTADVIFPQYPNRHVKADFVTVSKGFDLDTRTAITEFVINNEDGSIWPGSYAKVTLTVPGDKNALTIPSTALVFAEKGSQVAVVTHENKVHFKSIKIDKVLNGTLQINEGLSPNDKLIDNPSAALLEGDQVKIVEAAQGYASIS